MQALAIQTGVTLFGFEGVEKSQPFLERESKQETSIKVFFAYFLFQKKVCTFSSAGRAPDS